MDLSHWDKFLNEINFRRFSWFFVMKTRLWFYESVFMFDWISHCQNLASLIVDTCWNYSLNNLSAFLALFRHLQTKLWRDLNKTWMGFSEAYFFNHCCHRSFYSESFINSLNLNFNVFISLLRCLIFCHWNNSSVRFYSMIKIRLKWNSFCFQLRVITIRFWCMCVHACERLRTFAYRKSFKLWFV